MGYLDAQENYTSRSLAYGFSEFKEKTCLRHSAVFRHYT